jgi:DNA-binding NarL/FixJ family response regulator
MNAALDLPALKILLLDDHLLILKGFSAILHSMTPESDIKFFTSLEKVKEELAREKYDVLFSDLMMPGVNTREFITFCKKKYPDLIIIILSGILEINVVKEYLSIGVNGFISKVVSQEEVKLALETTHRGETFVSSNLSGKLAFSLFAAEKTSLTQRELEILRLIAAGHTVEKTASLLHISAFTVLAHRRSIMKKLDLHSGAELVKYAYENNLN